MKNRFNMFTKRTTFVFSLGLAAMTLTVNNLNAQDGGGLFGFGPSSESAGAYQEESLLRRPPKPTYSYADVNGDNSEPTGITINGIGQSNVPLGSGIAILIGAGLGYVALKKKEDEQ